MVHAHTDVRLQGKDEDQWVQGTHADAIGQSSSEGAEKEGQAHPVPSQQLP